MLVLGIISTIVSVAAFFFSIVSFNKSHATSRSLAEIESNRERDRVADQKKAQLIAEHFEKKNYRHGGHVNIPVIKEHYARITNIGQATAVNVEVLSNGANVLIDDEGTERKEVVESIGPSSYVDVYLKCWGQGSAPHFQIELRWDDATGVRGIYKSTLTV